MFIDLTYFVSIEAMLSWPESHLHETVDLDIAPIARETLCRIHLSSHN
jgi:hypothetical protein